MTLATSAWDLLSIPHYSRQYSNSWFPASNKLHSDARENRERGKKGHQKVRQRYHKKRARAEGEKNVSGKRNRISFPCAIFFIILHSVCVFCSREAGNPNENFPCGTKKQHKRGQFFGRVNDQKPSRESRSGWARKLAISFLANNRRRSCNVVSDPTFLKSGPRTVSQFGRRKKWNAVENWSSSTKVVSNATWVTRNRVGTLFLDTTLKNT